MASRRLHLVLMVIALIGAFTLSPNWTAAQTDAVELPPGFLGTWHGTAEQTSPAQSSEYEIQMELTGGEQYSPIGAVEYVGSNWSCSGSFVLWLVLDENTVAAGEHITSGNNVCPNGGFVLLTLNDDGTLSFEWRLPGMVDVATATLMAAE
jgi:hypothetical protein